MCKTLQQSAVVSAARVSEHRSFCFSLPDLTFTAGKESAQPRNFLFTFYLNTLRQKIIIHTLAKPQSKPELSGLGEIFELDFFAPFGAFEIYSFFKKPSFDMLLKNTFTLYN
ncbi:MAG: hypothetical protein HY965_06720 [Ignavibacteriales bacterium]|nr:hypothetical protein [Ignavibacteriales bacterium]